MKLSKVPKEMGKKVQEEFQKIIDEWTDQIVAPGVYQDKKFQKIERSES